MWRQIWGNDHLSCGFGLQRSHLALNWKSGQGKVGFHWGVITGTFHILVDTGGRSFAHGYTISMKGSALRLTVKDDRDYFYLMATPVAHNKWFHVVMTYMSATGIQLFLNGCDADVDGKHGYASHKDRRREFQRFFPFVFGRQKSSSYAVQNMMLDEFTIWHEKLSGSLIWEIYRGGEICDNCRTKCRVSMWDILLISSMCISYHKTVHLRLDRVSKKKWLHMQFIRRMGYKNIYTAFDKEQRREFERFFPFAFGRRKSNS